MKLHNKQLTLQPDNNNATAITVPQPIIKYWKWILSSIILLSALSLMILYTMLTKKHELAISQMETKYKTELGLAKNQLNSLEDKVDIEELKLAFASIDESIGTMHDYLEKRGIAVHSSGQKPSLDNLEQGSANLYASYYKQYAEKLNSKMETMPVGLPTEGAITSTFGTRANPFSGTGAESHKGIDFKGPMGQHIKSTAAGRVKLAAFHGGYGNCVIIDHGNSYETLYGHLSNISVKPGQVIKAGETIGNLGSTGRSTGPHLHYEVIKNGEKINPSTFLRL